jgi:3-oxoadipate enol-lactonase
MRDTFMDWHPNSELVVLPNVGHCPMQEMPIYITTLIEAFMHRFSE